MADKPTTIEFGKRRPAPLPEPTAPSPKRSSHVALLMMGAFAVGGGAYALMPKENCQPASPGMAAPATPPTATTCTSRGWSTGGHGRYSLFGGASSSRGSASGPAESNGVTRGGFGSFARAFGFGGGLS